MKKSIYIVAFLGLALYGLIILASPDLTTLLAGGAGIVTAVFFIVLALLGIRHPGTRHRMPWLYMAPLTLMFLVIPLIFTVILFIKGQLNILLIIVMVSLAFSFFYTFLNIPLAVYHKYEEIKLGEKYLDHYPPVSILVPAFNEEKCIAGTLETLLEADYPDKEIIVIDDGSTDDTLKIAKSYTKRGIKVLHRPNGGKAAALNYGLQLANGEIIVCVDADSMIVRTALIELVRRFEDDSVVAVAGNVKVYNRDKILTACQALEYIFDINIARRGLDLFGAVVVVPGCLGAFRAEALLETAGWDVETVVEDFDTTVKIAKRSAYDGRHPEAKIAHMEAPDFQVATKGMKTGRVVQASSKAIAYTEGPETVRGLWKQRLRWYRGNFQTMWKHRDAFTNTRFGSLYTLSFPYVLISMIFVPISMLAVIIAGGMAIIGGDGMPLLLIFGVFVILQYLVSILAIEMDDEDLKLALYAPLSVVGYKHLLDLAKLKAAFDVMTNRSMGWDKLDRIGIYQMELERKGQTQPQLGSKPVSSSTSAPHTNP
ncbi:MAG: glycosyltransferase [Chloroflexi bacterium]|nr:glycosyltransferase [Chloroflexota bacterium]MBM3175422.1 glycosyltransferase [Chloroflexota bacterium]MBM4450581.1 glycosyltransferase [Chloroflexota bacterium]